MKKQIYAHAGLRVVLEKLKETHPELSHIEYLPAKQAKAKEFLFNLPPKEKSVVIDGMDVVPMGEQNVVVPLVHNAAALLLGGNAVYRTLLSTYNVGVAFCFPGLDQIFYFSAPADCHLLCKIVDLDLQITDAPGSAHLEAALQEMDYIELPADYRLLASFLIDNL